MVRLNNLRDPNVPIYIAITGAWNLPDADSWLKAKRRTRSKKSVRQVGRRMKKEVKYTAKKIIESGNGIIVGGALGVDQIAAETALQYGDPSQLIVITPVDLDTYGNHYAASSESRGIISRNQAESLQRLLFWDIPENRIYDRSRFNEVNQKSYFARDQREVNLADAVIGFHLDGTRGTADTLNKSRMAGKPTIVRRYTADNPGWDDRFRANSYNLPESLRGWANRFKALDSIAERKLEYTSN